MISWQRFRQTKLRALDEKELDYTVIGTVTEEPAFVYGDVKITMEEALAAWTAKLGEGIPDQGSEGYRGSGQAMSTRQTVFMYANTRLQSPLYLFRYSPEPTANTTAQRHLSVQVHMWMTRVFSNLTAEDIRESVDEFEKSISTGTDHHVPRRLLRR